MVRPTHCELVGLTPFSRRKKYLLSEVERIGKFVSFLVMVK